MAPIRLVAGVLALISFGCAGPYQQETEGPRDSEAVLQPASGELGDPRPILQPEQEIAGVTAALDSGWADQARIALGRATDRRVKDFATTVLARRASSASEGPGAASSPLALEVSREAARTNTALLGERWRRFDRTYLDEQIRSYDAALTLIDERLLPRARDEAQGARLQSYREQLRADLDRAQELRTALGD